MCQWAEEKTNDWTLCCAEKLRLKKKMKKMEKMGKDEE